VEFIFVFTQKRKYKLFLIKLKRFSKGGAKKVGDVAASYVVVHVAYAVVVVPLTS
jgi:hypothetical protein